jgi:CRP-like cAMP-binding protein
VKDVFDPLSGTVPGSIAGTDVRRRRSSAGPRPDRPLGKEGVRLLGAVPLFSGLSKRHLRKLAERADEVAFAKGERIVGTGLLGGAFFVIIEGEAKVTKGKRVLTALGPGDFFGELALLDAGERLASVTAATPMRAVRLFKRSFDRLLAEEPGVAVKMLSVLAARIRRVEQSLTG